MYVSELNGGCEKIRQHNLEALYLLSIKEKIVINKVM